jgi:hypothetical protein
MLCKVFVKEPSDTAVPDILMGRMVNRTLRLRESLPSASDSPNLTENQ